VSTCVFHFARLPNIMLVEHCRSGWRRNIMLVKQCCCSWHRRTPTGVTRTLFTAPASEARGVVSYRCLADSEKHAHC
jgi:hypothetical protein